MTLGTMILSHMMNIARGGTLNIT